jgi:hypothetical protein
VLWGLPGVGGGGAFSTPLSFSVHKNCNILDTTLSLVFTVLRLVTVAAYFF